MMSRSSWLWLTPPSEYRCWPSTYFSFASRNSLAASTVSWSRLHDPVFSYSGLTALYSVSMPSFTPFFVVERSAMPALPTWLRICVLILPSMFRYRIAVITFPGVRGTCFAISPFIWPRMLALSSAVSALRNACFSSSLTFRPSGRCFLYFSLIRSMVFWTISNCPTGLRELMIRPI